MAKDNFGSSLTARLEAIEANRAVLRLPDRQVLRVPTKLLGGNCQPGTFVNVEFLTEEKFRRRQDNLGRAVLEEILEGK